MERYFLPLTVREYEPNLGFLRKTLTMNRTVTVTRLTVTNDFDHAVDLFIDNGNFYIIAIDFGAGPFRFSDPAFPAIAKARNFEFGGSYMDLNLHAEPKLELSAALMASAITELSHHKPNANGSGFFLRRKQAVIRLIFTVAEALRFWSIQRDVQALLRNPASSLDIKSYAGNGKPLNSWASWSSDGSWADRGIFVPALRS